MTNQPEAGGELLLGPRVALVQAGRTEPDPNFVAVEAIEHLGDPTFSPARHTSSRSVVLRILLHGHGISRSIDNLRVLTEPALRTKR